MILGIDDKLKLVSRIYVGPRQDENGKKGYLTVGRMKTPKKLDKNRRLSSVFMPLPLIIHGFI